MSTVREVTYRILCELSMKLLFGDPGSTELPFLRDMPPDYQNVLGLHERAAIGMGLGYAMSRGKPALVDVHSVARVGNGLSALIDAFYSHTPCGVHGKQDRRHLLAEPFLVSRAAATQCSSGLPGKAIQSGFLLISGARF